jgi:hypothetical protein
MWKQVFEMSFLRRSVIESALLAFVIGICVGCTVTRDEVVGGYQLQYEFGTERLLLGADGTYEQSFERRGASKELNKGQWELQGNGDKTVVLHNPMLVADPFGKPRPTPLRESGVALLRVKKWLGTVSLILNENQGLRFEKRA